MKKKSARKEKNVRLAYHVHLAYFGSELACSTCNPNCYKNHGIGEPFFCGDENCPSNPNKLPKRYEKVC